MPGTLTISTLSDGTNSTSATNAVMGSAKAWVNFNGGNGVIRASYNVSSVTRNATGDYTLAFTNALADTNYAAVFGTVGYTAGNAQLIHSIYGSQSGATTKTTTQLRTVGGSGGAGAYDSPETCVAIFR